MQLIDDLAQQQLGVAPAPGLVMPGAGDGAQRGIVAASPDGAGWRPPSALPDASAVRYWRDAITLALILIALPWLLYHLVTNPGRVLAGRGPTGAV